MTNPKPGVKIKHKLGDQIFDGAEVHGSFFILCNAGIYTALPIIDYDIVQEERWEDVTAQVEARGLQLFPTKNAPMGSVPHSSNYRLRKICRECGRMDEFTQSCTDKADWAFKVERKVSS